jgi:hypothetical protein
MACQLTLAPDIDRGGHRYSAALTGHVDAAAIAELSDWLADAKQNPDARFELDLSGAEALGDVESAALDALLARHHELRAERRLTLIERAVAEAPMPAVKPTTVERAIMVVGSGAPTF